MVKDPFENDELTAAVAGEAHNLARRYYQWVEFDDVRQQMMYTVAKQYEKFAELLDYEEGDKDAEKVAWAQIRKILWRHGDRYCRKEKAAKCGYRTSDEAFYDKTLVRNLILMQYNGTSPTNQFDDSKPLRGRTVPGSGYSLETQYADIDRALSKLPALDRAIVMAIFRDEVSETDAAKTFDMSRSKVQRTLSSACRKIIDFLGGPSPY